MPGIEVSGKEGIECSTVSLTRKSAEERKLHKVANNGVQTTSASDRCYVCTCVVCVRAHVGVCVIVWVSQADCVIVATISLPIIQV